MNKLRYRMAEKLVQLANYIYPKSAGLSHFPNYRQIDGPNETITGSKWPCAAYSYEMLKSLVEQDGPDGFGATATIAWLIGDEGWKDITADNIDEVRRSLAISGIDLDDVSQGHE